MTKIFPCRFFGSGIWECLHWVFLAQDLPSTCDQDMNWDCRHLKIRLALGVCSQAVPMHGWKVSAGCWWKASNIYHVNIPMGLLECPHNILAGFPRWIIPKRAQWKVQQPQRSHLIVTAISFGYTGQPYFCGRNLHRGVNIRRGASLRPYWSLVSTKRETQRGITAQQLILGFSGWNTGCEFLVTLWPLPGIKPWTLPHSKPPRILYAAAFQLSRVHWQHLN